MAHRVVLLYGFCLAVLLIAIHPYRDGYEAFQKRFPPHFHDGYEQIDGMMAEALPLSAATSTYRGGPARSGNRGAEALLPFRVEQTIPVLNVGVHTASKASPAVDASGIYLGTDSGWLYALNLDGKVRWSYFTRAERGIHGSAILDDEFVYFGSYRGVLTCLRKSDGKLMWVRPLGEAIGSSPVFWEDSLLVTSEMNWHLNGRLHRLDRKTGKPLWASEWAGEQVHSSPAIDEKEGLAFFGANNGRFLAVDLSSGKTRWSTQMKGPMKGTPAVHEGMVFVTSWGSEAAAFQSKTGDQIWHTDLVSGSQSSPTLFPNQDRLVFLSHFGNQNYLYGLSLSSGQMIWKKNLGEGSWGTGSGSAFLEKLENEEKVLISCGAREICVVSPKDGALEQTISLLGQVTGEPTFSGNRVYLAVNEGALVILQSRDEATER